MKKKNEYVKLKKHSYLDHLSFDGLISQLIIYYGDALSVARSAVSSDGDINFKQSLDITSDLLLCISRLDILVKRKGRAWWKGEIDDFQANLHDNQSVFISGLYKLSDNESTPLDIEVGIDNLQQSIETIAVSFDIDLVKIIEDLNKSFIASKEVIEDEFKSKGTYTLDIKTSAKGKYVGINLEDKKKNKLFKTGVINMDFFNATTYATNNNREYGIKLTDKLKEYIDALNDYFVIKFFNNADPSDNVFYTLRTEGSSNRLFRGDEDVTNKVTIKRKDISLIPFMDYSMVLVTPEMLSLDDLLDYYNKNK